MSVEYEFDGLTRAGRVLAWFFGHGRVVRWSTPPREPGRCPWVSPLDHDQCIRDAGHPGACHTEKRRTNIQTGRVVTSTREWWGINYRSDTSEPAPPSP